MYVLHDQKVQLSDVLFFQDARRGRTNRKNGAWPTRERGQAASARRGQAKAGRRAPTSEARGESKENPRAWTKATTNGFDQRAGAHPHSLNKRERMEKKELEGSWSLGNTKKDPKLFCYNDKGALLRYLFNLDLRPFHTFFMREVATYVLATFYYCVWICSLSCQLHCWYLL